jgi:hypothetical protein
LTGNPCPLDQELGALAPQIELVLFGTNEIRYGWTFDEAGTHLWDLVDRTIARGVIPVMSTVPANTGYPEANARVPTYNRVVRAIAQGRGVPLVDLYHELAPLANHGISSDGLHPSVAPDGGCVLTSAGLAYGYNVRNLITLEALARTHAALAGVAADASAPLRSGSGTESAPFAGALPLVDLGDTRGTAASIDHGCGASSGHQVVYRVAVSSPTTIDAYVVDRPGTDVDVRIVADGTCVASGDASASASVAAGNVEVIVAATNATNDGEFLLVVERH